MDDLTNVTLDMLINIYKTSLDYLTNGPLTYSLTFKSSLESIHCIYIRMELQFTIFRLMLFHFVCFRHFLGKHFYSSVNFRYQCRATNHGEDKAEGELIIKDVTTIVSGPSDRTETMGDSIVMECQVVADPTVPLSVTWKKKNTIDLGQTGFEQNARVFQNENNSLVIKNLTFDDSGNKDN